MTLAPFPAIPSAGALPVVTEADVLATYPAPQQAPEEAPVRDAIVDAQAALFLAWQVASGYAAAQSDPTRSTGRYLEQLAEDRGVLPQEGESSSALRTRVFATPSVVTPEAIKGVVDAILGEFTEKRCHVWETVLDRLFLNEGGDSVSWHSFIGDGEVSYTPEYPTRYYEARGQASPGGAFLFDDHRGRRFVLRLPDLGGVADAVAFAFDGTLPVTQDRVGLYLQDGTDPDGSAGTFLFDGTQDAITIYQRIVNAVATIKGHGIRFDLHIDPKL